MRRRIVSALEGVPLLFVGIVLGVTLLFRLTIDAIRPSTEDAADAAKVAAPHEPPSPARPALDPRPEPSVDATRTPATAAERSPTTPPRALPAAPRRKPRTHGRR